MLRERENGPEAGRVPGESLSRYLVRTIRVRIGPFVRHVLAALHGGPWRKRVRSIPKVEHVRILRPDGRSLAGCLYRPETAPGTNGDPGPAMLMLHGWDPQGQRHGLYVALADALARRGWSVLTINLPGYPGSDPPVDPAGYDLTELTGAALAALDDLVGRDEVDEERLVLLGHSYGAGLVIPLLRERPWLARAVIYGPSIWVVEMMTGPEATHQAFYHERYWRYMHGVSPVPLSQYVSLMNDIYIPHQVDELPDGHPPILLLDGGAEKAKALAFSAHVHDLLPPPRDYWSIPGTDHFCNSAVIGGVLIEDRAAIESLTEKLIDWCGWQT